MSNDPMRDLLQAVVDALTLPPDTPDYDQRLLNRATLAHTVASAALAEAPADLEWDADYLQRKLADEQAEAADRENNRCRRCRAPFDPADARFDGRARHRETPWCRQCVDNCHDSGSEHVCVICAPARYGGDGR
ncbi:hypothetical protein QCN29_26885 [Streptomyces sp. HNM0663]|uniref:HNH endonuclease n=1 Tax=Streptomyces chengmaiensis TaxID=3040919 RepID=A0ABT6HUE3_9ACTN|nr:hypothetical protein [Streptomyces chengmaiensis]MDH2392338.1 hypothetical protein [Streptomyces chengmaiensis]